MPPEKLTVFIASSRLRCCERSFWLATIFEEPEFITPYDINIIGEYNLAGELWQVKPLLDELGIRIFVDQAAPGA